MAHDPSSSAPLAPLSLSWPIVGMLPTVLSSNRMQGFFRLASKGRTYRGYVVGMGAFHNLSGGEGLRVLDSEHPASKWPEAMERIFGPGSLLTTNGAEWRRLRKLLGSAMTPWQLAASLPDIVGAVRDALTRWARESAEAAAMGSKPPLGAPRIKCMALDILLRAIVGMTVDVEEVERIAVVLKDVAAGILMPTEWYMPGHGLFAKAMNRSEEIRESFRPYLEHARRAATQGELSGDQAAKQEGGLEDQALPRSKSVRLDMRSSSLLYRLAACRDEEGRPLSDAACMDNLLVFLFAGHETTASATSNLLPMLAHHPRWEERLRQEQRWDEDAVAGPGVSVVAGDDVSGWVSLLPGRSWHSMARTSRWRSWARWRWPTRWSERFCASSRLPPRARTASLTAPSSRTDTRWAAHLEMAEESWHARCQCVGN